MKFTFGLKNQEYLIKELFENPLPDSIKKVEVPIYFVMGKYDGMTSPELAEEYLKEIESDTTKEFILFEESGHYPHFEEKEKFAEWMKKIFIEKGEINI